MLEHGTRVGVWAKVQGRTVWWVGEGTFLGSDMAPGYLKPTPELVRNWLATDPEVIEVGVDVMTLDDAQIQEVVDEMVADPRRYAFKIAMDDGTLAWSTEVAFDELAKVERAIAGFKVIPCRILRNEIGQAISIVEVPEKDHPY